MATIPPTARILLVAVLAGALGIAASLWMTGPGPLLGPILRTELGQRLFQGMLAADAPEPPPGLAIATRGSVMPPLLLPGVDGQSVALPQAYAGRTILFNFWASWCGPCIVEMPELDRFAGTQGTNGTQVVGIALDRPDDVRAFLQRTPVTYPILLDTPGAGDSSVQLGNATGVLPYTALVGPDGRLLKQKIGPFAEGEIDAWAQL